MPKVYIECRMLHSKNQNRAPYCCWFLPLLLSPHQLDLAALPCHHPMVVWLSVPLCIVIQPTGMKNKANQRWALFSWVGVSFPWLLVTYAFLLHSAIVICENHKWVNIYKSCYKLLPTVYYVTQENLSVCDIGRCKRYKDNYIHFICFCSHFFIKRSHIS